MNKLEIRFGEVDTAASVMRDVASWGREQGYRVWPDEWLTKEELITPDAQPENFCIGMVDGKLPVLLSCNGRIPPIGPAHLNMKPPICTNSVCGASSPAWA